MVARKDITKFARRIAKEFSPEKILLFGSYANGKPTKDSDVDLLVIMRHSGHGAEQAARIRRTIRSGFPLDLIVRTPKKVRSRLRMGDSFIRDVVENGKVLYEADHA